ncbi:hypothetical protein Q31b_36140 [Novipirellula aureliae]|uniref:Uncharacterized protein n=1 Tax=Novipirellula aureliae TaxID=2527966 RepID=A0A5C6DWH0_9BACT|nr:hypothetical protein [Novipirellula aureliae]TWU40267.1 hypothetical protein Q31b_36140 [Novipirellula aureliae]
MKYVIDLPAEIQHGLSAHANETGQDVVDLIQLAVTRFVSEEVGANGSDSQWTPEKDDRRCVLIDREIAGTIGVPERAELAGLQKMAERHFDEIASPPLEEALKPHKRLLSQPDA